MSPLWAYYLRIGSIIAPGPTCCQIADPNRKQSAISPLVMWEPAAERCDFRLTLDLLQAGEAEQQPLGPNTVLELNGDFVVPA